MARGARKRWPWVTAPLTTSPWRTLTTLPPCSAAIQRTGRAKVTSSQRERMAFLKRSPVSRRVRSAGSTCSTLFPCSTLVRPSRSPLGVSIRSSASTATPWLRANPSAAAVGFPSASKALDTDGPSASLLASAWRAASARAQTTSRRGVPIAFTSPWVIRASASSRARSSSSCFTAGGTKPAGSSSVPISNRRSAMFSLTKVGGGYGPAGAAASRAALAAATAAARALGGSSGKPSASRDSRYSLAQRWASARTRPM